MYKVAIPSNMYEEVIPSVRSIGEILSTLLAIVGLPRGSLLSLVPSFFTLVIGDLAKELRKAVCCLQMIKF